jgi:DNA-binding NarL/FixJ family response regulator
MKPIRVVIADDHRLFLLGIRNVLDAAEDIEVVGEADCGTKALSLIATRRPDLALLDVNMPQLDGIACLDTVRMRHPDVKVAMVSGVQDPEVIENALRHGASAFILKSVNPDDLAAVVRHIMSGTVIQSLGVPAERETAADTGHELTERETAILDGLARGLSNHAIAKELWIAEPTVKFHVRNIYRKLGVANRTAAARFAYEHGLVDATHPAPTPAFA